MSEAESDPRDQIRKLVTLQEGDADIYTIRKELEEKPVRLQELEEAFAQKKTRLNTLEADFKKIQVERNSLEGDLAQKEQAIHKAEAQLSQIKTNKEYTAKIGEIEGLKADKSIVEEQILQSYDRADAVKAQIDAERQTLAKDETEFLEQKKTVQDEIQALKARIAEAEAGRAHRLEGIDKNLLARYERILNSRDGLAVVPVVGTCCGGCFMNVPQQVINEIRKRKEIIFCEICTRILYLEDDLNRETA